MSRSVKIAPSILAADFAALGTEIRAMDDAGADMIHIDVMDGHFVPNISIGPAVVKSLRAASTKPFDVHLMIAPVDEFLPPFAEAGADLISIHPEAGPHTHRSLQKIKAMGRKAGLVLNPATPPEAAGPVLEMLDLVLVMSVNPGFGGQSFIASQLDKIAALRRMIDAAGLAVALSVDGGVNAQTAPRCIAAGADILVAGAAAFQGGAACYADNIRDLRGNAQTAG